MKREIKCSRGTWVELLNQLGGGGEYKTFKQFVTSLWPLLVAWVTHECHTRNSHMIYNCRHKYLNQLNRITCLEEVSAVTPYCWQSCELSRRACRSDLDDLTAIRRTQAPLPILHVTKRTDRRSGVIELVHSCSSLSSPEVEGDFHLWCMVIERCSIK